MERLKHFSLSALMIALAALTACSSEDNIVNDQTANPTEPKMYTMTIQASKGDASTTRGLAFDGEALNVIWNDGEEVEVMQRTQVTPEVWTSLGKLKAQASANATTTLTGELQGLKDASGSIFPLVFYLHSIDMNYTGQNGVLDRDDNATKSIEANYDHAMSSTVSDFTVDGNTVTVSGGVTLTSLQAIVKFTLVDALTGNPLNATSLNIKGSQYMIESMNPTAGTKLTHELTITPASDTNVIYAAISSLANSNFTLTATTEDNKTYTYEKSGVTFKEGKYYDVNVQMLPEGYVNLARLTADYEAKNGDVLYGTLANNVKISIKAGATVTLHNVSINTDGAWTNSNWAGITCLGDATIKLKGKNIVTGFSGKYPGIQAAHNTVANAAEYTLTIQGSDADELIASSNSKSTPGTGGAGIGGGDDVSCGNIVIAGGRITAESNGFAADIGSGGDAGVDVCGNITISGGIVNATCSRNSCGIGAGVARCMNMTITISGGTVTATGYHQGPGIGAGSAGSCGNIIISGGTVTATASNSNNIPSAAAGIGTGNVLSSCGNITITNTNNATKVTATKGANAVYSIGLGLVGNNSDNFCGTITIGGTKYYDGTNKTWASEELENALKAATFTYPAP